MMFKFALLLCLLGIHRFKVIDISFGFGASGTIKVVQCKICRIKKVKKDGILDEVRDRRRFMKPSERKRLKRIRARAARNKQKSD